MSIERTFVVGRPLDAPLERFGRYTLFHELAPGGMAAVHVAKKDGAEEPCVLKRLHVHLEQQSQVRKRFLREADVASQLMHDNIARVLDAGFEGETFYMAVEFVAGQDVGTVTSQLALAGNKLHFQLVACIALQALEGLAYAHEAVDGEGRPLGVVHRDLSSRNLMVHYDGRVKLIDFGLVRTTAGDPLTAVGVLLGTPRYMSPEQAATDPVDLRSDIFSLGVVLYELIAGQVAFRGTQPLEVLRNVLTYRPPPLTQVAPEVPPALSDAIERAMSKSAGDRYASAREFAEEIRRTAGVTVEAVRPHLAEMMKSLFTREIVQMERLLAGARQGTGITPVSPVDMGDPQRAERTVTRTAAEVSAPTPMPLPSMAVAPARVSTTKIVQLVLAAIAGGLTVGVLMLSIFAEHPPPPSAPPPPAAPPSAPASPTVVENAVPLGPEDEPPPVESPPAPPPKRRIRVEKARPAPPLAKARAPKSAETLAQRLAKLRAGGGDQQLVDGICRDLKQRSRAASPEAQRKAAGPLAMGCRGQRPVPNFIRALRALEER